MGYIEIFVLALALSIDSLVVSATCGMQKSLKQGRGLVMAFSFALFQGCFPLIGSFVGNFFQSEISVFDHWIAFALLLVIGSKMFIEAIQSKRQECSFDMGRFSVIIGLSVATSIDAFIVGIGLGLEINDTFRLLMASLIIGVVTFLAAILGLIIGRQGKIFPSRWALAIGGLVLIGIGIKVLIEHHAIG